MGQFEAVAALNFAVHYELYSCIVTEVDDVEFGNADA